jgi:tight adherence protein B
VTLSHLLAERAAILKWVSIGAFFVALFVGALSQAADPTSFFYRYYSRYCSSLERKLRPMFIFTPGRHIALGQVGASFVFVIAHILFHVPYWGIGLLIIAIVPTAYIEQMRRQRVEAIELQLDGFLLALSNGLKSTPNIGAALASVATVIQAPIRQEVELALKEMKVGSSLDQALLHMAARIGSRKVDSALSAILIGRQVGGNLPKVLETTSATMREMQRLEGVVRTKTAEGKFQLWAIAAMPIALLFMMNAMWPGYFDPLSQSIIGYLVAGGSAALWVTAVVLARKILAVDL